MGEGNFRVFSTRIITAAGVQLMQDAGIEVNQWQEKRELSRSELLELCRQHHALILAGPLKIDSEFLDQCRHLKVIALHGVGFDNVDIEAATKLGIPVGNTPGVVDRATAETAFLLMLAVSRKALHNHKRIINGQWSFFEPTANLGIELSAKTLGIFGLGSIGFQMARLCKAAFDMNVLYCNRKPSIVAEQQLGAVRVSFDELLRRSDVLSVHAVLSAETRGLFNEDAFRRMKSSSLFINTARGAIHDETALLAALQNRTIWGAGLDVTSPEPMRPDNPLLNMEFATVLPHIGTSTEETRIRMVTLIARNVIAASRGEAIPFPVNPEVYAGGA